MRTGKTPLRLPRERSQLWLQLRGWLVVGWRRGAQLARTLWDRLVHLYRTLRNGPAPFLAEDDEAAGATADVTAVTAPDASPSPSSRWDKLAEQGDGRVVARNVATVAVGLMVLAVVAFVALSGGEADDPSASAETSSTVAAAAPASAEQAPTTLPAPGLEEPAPGLRLAPAPAEALALDDDEEEEEEAAPAAPTPAPVADPEPTPVAQPAPAPAAVASTPSAVEPAPTADEEIGADEAAALARKAGCPAGSLPTVVLPGDTVQNIAWRHVGADARRFVPRILAANPALKPERMQPGDRVCVPDVRRVIVDYADTAYEIRRGDTIGGLASRFGHLSRGNIRALTSRIRRNDMLYVGTSFPVPVPRYASR